MAQKHLGLKPVACAMLFGGNVHAGALQWKLVCVKLCECSTSIKVPISKHIHCGGLAG